MPIPHPSDWGERLLSTANPDPFIWLFDFRNPDGGPPLNAAGEPVTIHVTPNREPLVFGVDVLGAPISWQPCPLHLGDIQRDATGAVTSFTLSISNAASWVMKIAEANGYFDDYEVLVHLVDASQLSDPAQKATIITTVSDMVIGWNALTLTLSGFDLAAFEVPTDLITRDACRFARQYRGPGCGFVGDPGNAELGLCQGTFSECEARGVWEITNGIEHRHPKRFGAFRGLPSGAITTP